MISDIGMPGEDGYAFMRALTEELGQQSPRVRIALSAFAAPGDGEQRSPPASSAMWRSRSTRTR